MAAQLSLTAQCDAIDVYGYRYNKSRSDSDGVAVDTWAPLDSGVVEHDARLDSLPLGSPVLEPNLHLDLAEAQLTGDQRPLGQRQVLLAGELAFQLHQLVAAERRPPPSTTLPLVRRVLTGGFGGGGRRRAFDIVVRVGSVGVSGLLRPAGIIVDR